MTGSHIYFAKPVGADGPIKIGCSRSPQYRIAKFMAWSPVPLEIIATIAGDFSQEARLHRRFRGDRLHGEWFRPSPDLIALIEDARGANRLPLGPLPTRAALRGLPAILDAGGISRDAFAAHVGCHAMTLGRWITTGSLQAPATVAQALEELGIACDPTALFADPT